MPLAVVAATATTAAVAAAEVAAAGAGAGASAAATVAVALRGGSDRMRRGRTLLVAKPAPGMRYVFT